MSDLVRYEVRDGVAIVTVDNPPVNALSPGVPEGIEEAVARAGADPAVKGVVLIGAGTTFIAGADIRYFGTIPSRESSLERSRSLHARLVRIEDCPKPLVAAIRR
ncbi:MAG: enoyl-CoA hydratase/isomerase family protein [Bryobacteraceae bacterium]